MIEDLPRSRKRTSTVLDDPTRKKQVWAAREAGLGATAYPPTAPKPTKAGRMRPCRRTGSAIICANSPIC